MSPVVRHLIQAARGSVLLSPVWFAIVAGLTDGAGRLLFQKINWARWGPTLQVSEQIIWISPVVDVVLFSALILALSFVCKARYKITREACHRGSAERADDLRLARGHGPFFSRRLPAAGHGSCLGLLVSSARRWHSAVGEANERLTRPAGIQVRAWRFWCPEALSLT